MGRLKTNYETKKKRSREMSRAESMVGRDIGQIPPVINPDRRERCRYNFRLFCETYFPSRFTIAWSDDHLLFIDKIERTILEGQLFALAMPRGSGKTTLCEIAVIWADVYGHANYIFVIAAAKDKATEILDGLKTELSNNELLLQDFPEVIYPIIRLENEPRRCLGQRHAGKPTYIQWGKNKIVMPTILGSCASGCIIQTAGITSSAIRGPKHTRATGETVRPSLVLIDDPQTDASALSPVAVRKRLDLIKGTILGMAGPGKKIAALCPCTVIAANDVADQLLDREKNPVWQGERVSLVKSFPINQELWDRYADLRRRSFAEGHTGEEATEFYRKHFAAMNEGAKVYWPGRYEPDEISAVQYAQNKLIDRPETFFAEFQNKPGERDEKSAIDNATDNAVANLNRLPRGVAPLNATKLTAFIDVQHSIFYYAVVAWSSDFTGAVIDYGTYPDQKREYFTLSEVRNTLKRATGETSLEGSVAVGLEKIIDILFAQTYKTEDGSEIFLEALGIDVKDGNLTDTLHKVIRRHQRRANLYASQGRGIGPTEKPISQYTRKEGEQIGENWILGKSAKHANRLFTVDTNSWKRFLFDRLATPGNSRGSLSLFGRDPVTHRMIIDHLRAETGEKVTAEKTRRTVTIYKQKPGRPDNHWLDCLSNCCALASLKGCTLTPVRPGTTDKKRLPKRERVSYLNT
jgi:energy-coupling factor transporter ATP-binding protein EcfA2